MSIVIDKFLERQFDPEFAGTSLVFDQYEQIIDESGNENLIRKEIDYKKYYGHLLNIIYYEIETLGNHESQKLIDADDPKMDFCKYLIFKNNTNVKQGTIKITEDIEPFIVSEYKARNENELPILSRYVKLPYDMYKPNANYLVCILYSKEQLRKEYKGDLKEFDKIYTEDVKYGCIAILGTEMNKPDPMPPITMMRNALGVDEGGNGVKLDKDLYNESVEFWSKNILIK